MPGQVYSRPIAALVFALMGGITLGPQFAGYSVGAVIIIILSAALTGFNIWRRKATRWLPLILFVALGYVSIQPWVSPSLPNHHIDSYSDETRWQISGEVLSHPREFKYLQRFVLRADSLAYKKTTYPVHGRVRVTVRGRGPAIAKGDRVVFHSRLRRPRNFNNPGGFNYQRYMAFKGICRTAYTRGDRLLVVQKAVAVDLSHQLTTARRSMATLIDSAGREPSTAILKALIIGDRAAISTQLRNQFNRAGVGHLLAISGLHIGIVATVAFFLFQRLLRFMPPLLWRAWTRKGAAIFSLLPVFSYGLISGMSPSTQRAVIMVSAFLLTFVVERERDALNILALAAFIILIIYPPSLFSISFQLSFMAVLSILFGVSLIKQAKADAQSRPANGLVHQMGRKALDFFLVSVFAICGTLPLVMFYFNQISLIGLLANFIFVPLVGFGVIPCGLLALFVYPFSSQLALIGVKICVLVLDIVLPLIGFVADLPFAAIKTITPSLLEIICYYLLGWALLRHLYPQPASPEPHLQSGAFTETDPSADDHRLDRFKRNLFFTRLKAIFSWLSARFASKKYIIVGLGVVLVLLVDAGYWIGQRYWDDDLRITYLDVGQGNAALLELPGGHTALIDGGGFSDNTAFDMGARVIAPFLLRKKIRTIDTLVLSHPNSDHLNGLIYIAEHFNVKNIWTNGETRNTAGYRHFRNVIERQQLSVPDFKQLDRRHKVNGVEFCFLYPPTNFLARKVSDKWRNTNNNSLVLKISFGNISFLFPGDIMLEAEKELVELAASELACDVLLVPHHGSRSSSSPPFLAAVQPKIAVISAGWQNRFRFPHPTVTDAYREMGCRILRTDRNGAIQIRTDGHGLTVKPFISLDVPF